MNHSQTSTPLESVSVVIVNYNAGLLLNECVSAALQQAQQIIVIDNGSHDFCPPALRKVFPEQHRLQILALDTNTGFAAGCNTGIGLATQPFMLFLNPDCILTGGSLHRMMQVMQSDTQIGMVGGYLINPDGTEQGGGRRAIPTPWRALVRAFGLYRLGKFWPELFFDFHLDKQPLPQSSIEVEAISGALMLVRREAIEDVGSWDEGYFLHCEDLDWCVRFRQKNWKIVFVPDAPVTHFKGACSQARPFFVAWHKHRGMLRFYRKFFQQQYSGILMGMVTLVVWSRFGATVLFHTLQSGYRFLKSKYG